MTASPHLARASVAPTVSLFAPAADLRWRSIADRQIVAVASGARTVTALELPATERARS